MVYRLSPWLLSTTLLLAGCGSDGGEPGHAADSNQIERLSTPKVEKADPRATARLQPITREDLEQEGLVGAGCAFRSGERMLLASVGSDAIVRHAGAIRHMIHSAPVGATGGFFEDRQLSVSVGRTDDASTAGDGGTSWPARITVTNRRTEAQVEMRGTWTCGG